MFSSPKPLLRPRSVRGQTRAGNRVLSPLLHGDGSYALRGPKKVAEQKSTSIPLAPQNTLHSQPSVARASNPTTHTRREPLSRPQDPIPKPPPRFRVQSPAQRAVAADVSPVQADELQKKIEQLQRENQKFRQDLKAATDAKLAKQGEVTILRKGMEKVAQDHATQVSNLKLAKEESEAKQIALQKEMKAEMERLKTQFIFKQHELESSSRKPPPSVRSKRIAKDFPSTPLAVPSQLRGRDRISSGFGFPEQSPIRQRTVRGSPPGAHARNTPEKPKKALKLLGFQNSFTDATPVRSRVRPEAAMPVQPSLFAETPFSTSPIPSPQQDNDIKMTAANFGDELAGPEERTGDEIAVDEVQPFNWKAELTRIILTHVFPPNISPTFGILVGLSLPMEYAERYSQNITRVLEVVASTSQPKDYETSLLRICQFFISMIEVLNATDLISALAALINLLTSLSCSLPMFTASVLAEDSDGFDIIPILCSVIRNQLIPAKHGGSALGNEVVGLLEGLCWNVRDDLLGRLARLCNQTDVWMILLDNLQPSWLLHCHSLSFVLTTEDPELSRDLLTISEHAVSSEHGVAKEAPRLLHIERLCSYLIDTDRKELEASSRHPHSWNQHLPKR
ncbi:hypothetical protein B0H15DRAFT_805678 [Mycena belliarum]|uniref:DNA repair protein Rad26 n=1 Tax=Mycena belliarum TaxID=1033014 RepID=A0AAD6XFZ5_9AGAR|nr:hypothetical protein B0H15DRAFT_805678 [Mycena belliae]